MFADKTADGKVTEEIKAIIKREPRVKFREIEQDIVERVFHRDRKINSLMTLHKVSLFFHCILNIKERLEVYELAFNLSRLMKTMMIL
jgi:hypothetical protein